MSTVLVVDDKEMMRDSVGSTLQRAGFTVISAADGRAALDLIARRRPEAVVTDLKMPGLTGIELLEKIREIDDELPVVLMTAFGTVETAVKAIKLGAYDYVTKPFEGDVLVIAVKRAIQHAAVMRENAVLRAAADEPGPALPADGEGARRGLARIIGQSEAIRRVKEQVAAVAQSQGTVLIVGESGVGKEVIARAIHECSPRAGGPFLGVNCAALSEGVLESELFGHERGAFTGAERLRKGRFELAHGGTLLLDEVSEVGPHIQAKLLRVLQERAFERVGSSVTMGVDVRVVATSNRDLPGEAAAGRFRQDLYFRLNVLPVHVPPLRERLEDVPALAAHFVEQIARREGRPPARFDEGALALLRAYTWPGNVRELANICERAVVLGAATGPVIRRELIEPWLGVRAEWSPAPAGPAPAAMERRATPIAPSGWSNGSPHAHVEVKPGTNGHGLGQAPAATRPLEEIEREAIIAALHRFNGHRQKTAKALGIGVRTLGLKLKKWKELRLVEEGL